MTDKFESPEREEFRTEAEELNKIAAKMDDMEDMIKDGAAKISLHPENFFG